jgi:phage gp45-like
VIQPKGIASEIVITVENGQKLKLKVKSDTIISDKNGDKIPLDKIKQGDKVVIECKAVKETIEEAESIKLSRE